MKDKQKVLEKKVNPNRKIDGNLDGQIAIILVRQIYNQIDKYIDRLV